MDAAFASGVMFLCSISPIMPGEPAGPYPFADQVAPEREVSCEFPGFDAQRLKWCNKISRQPLPPQLRGPHLNQVGLLMTVQEDDAHGMQVPQETTQMRCVFIPIAQDETREIHLRCLYRCSG